MIQIVLWRIRELGAGWSEPDVRKFGALCGWLDLVVALLWTGYFLVAIDNFSLTHFLFNDYLLMAEVLFCILKFKVPRFVVELARGFLCLMCVVCVVRVVVHLQLGNYLMVALSASYILIAIPNIFFYYRWIQLQAPKGIE